MSKSEKILRVASLIAGFLLVDLIGAYFDIAPASWSRGAATLTLVLLVIAAYVVSPLSSSKSEG
jgi:hypothetical protein